jgi:hypothetical protein
VASAAYVQALADVAHDVYHLPGYVALEAARVDGTAVAYLYREGGLTFVLPLVLRPVPGSIGAVDAMSPYGYPGPVLGPAGRAGDGGRDVLRRALDALPEVLGAADVISCFVRLHPQLSIDPDLLHLGTLVRHADTVALDLTLDGETAWAQVRSNHRRQITKARASGMVTTFDDWSRATEFLALYHETMTRVAADASYFFDRPYLEDLRAAVGGDLHLVTVTDANDGTGELLGAGLFFSCGDIVQYHLGATGNRHLARQPAKLMMDDVRRWGAARGMRYLHLGAGVGGRADDSLFHFKAGFGPGRSAFATWRLVLDPVAYDRLAGGRDRLGDRGFFPVYRQPPAEATEPTPRPAAESRS